MRVFKQTNMLEKGTIGIKRFNETGSRKFYSFFSFSHDFCPSVLLGQILNLGWMRKLEFL